MRKIGDRIGAILSSDDDYVYFLGYGTYAGEEVPSDDVTMLGMQYNKFGRKNPKLQLDNGEVIYGCECWWGPEDSIKHKLGKDPRIIKEVSIIPYRQEAMKTRSEEHA